MNFVVDDDHLMRLIEEAQRLGKHQTKEEAVNAALKGTFKKKRNRIDERSSSAKPKRTAQAILSEPSSLNPDLIGLVFLPPSR